jgi:hypothetical protein
MSACLHALDPRRRKEASMAAEGLWPEARGSKVRTLRSAPSQGRGLAQCGRRIFALVWRLWWRSVMARRVRQMHPGTGLTPAHPPPNTSHKSPRGPPPDSPGLGDLQPQRDRISVDTPHRELLPRLRLPDDHRRRRCRSIPTNCLPSYSDAGASFVVSR